VTSQTFVRKCATVFGGSLSHAREEIVFTKNLKYSGIFEKYGVAHGTCTFVHVHVHNVHLHTCTFRGELLNVTRRAGLVKNGIKASRNLWLAPLDSS